MKAGKRGNKYGRGGVRSLAVSCAAFALYAVLALAACAPQNRSQEQPPKLANPLAASLSADNRLDLALAAAPQGWRFSALMATDGRRLPLQILVRSGTGAKADGADKTSRTNETPYLEAILLTETGLGLCSLSAGSSAVEVQTRLPDSRISGLCQRVGTALQRLILSPQPEATDRAPVGTDQTPPGLIDPMDHALKTVLWRQAGDEALGFYFQPGGPLAEKRAVRNDALQWRAIYGNHETKGNFFVPRNWRYAESLWNIRMLLLPPEGMHDGQNQR